MKKITLITILCLTINFTFSQVLFQEDFDGSGPGLAGWNVVDVDGNTPNASVAEFTDAWIEREDYTDATNTVAASTSWYSPAGTSNDWMISPAIAITGNAILTWDEFAPDASYPDGYQVLISSTGNMVSDFTDSPVLTVGAANSTAFLTRTVDLSSFNGQTIHIAWRNNSTDQFVLTIDNVLVEVPLQFDATITAIAGPADQYTQTPVDQATAISTNAVIDNLGTSSVTNAVATISVTNGTGASVYTESSSPFTIPSGGSQAVTFTGYVPTMVDTYTTTYSVAIAESDANTSNDTATTTSEITTGTYARDDNTPAGSLGIGANNGGFLGQQFDIIVSQDLNSVTFAIGNVNAVLTGLQVRATVWDMAAGVPNTQIATTDFVTVTPTENDVYTANITGGPLTLAAGQYLVAIEEPDAAGGMPTDENVQIVTTTDVFTAGTTWVNWPTNPNGTWSNNEDFNFNASYLLRPNFDQILSTDEFSLATNALSLYPNPSKNTVTIGNPNQIQLLSASIIDISGRTLKVYDLSGTVDSERMLDISYLSPANYFVTIQSSNGSVTKQLIVK